MKVVEKTNYRRPISKPHGMIDLAKLAHDLKGPLNSIKGLLIIANSEINDEGAKKHLRLIEKYQQLLYNRIDKTLNTVRSGESGNSPTGLNLNQVFEGFKFSLRNIGSFATMGLNERSNYKVPFSERIYKVNTVINIMNALHSAYNRSLDEKRRDGNIDIVKLAHDIKGPLNSIRGLLEVAQLEVESEVARGYFELILKCQQQLYSRVEETLKRANENETPSVQIDFEEMINRIQSSLRHMSGFSEIDFDISISNVVPFFSDREAVYSIVQNLMENAIKYRKHDNSSHLVRVDICDSPEGIEFSITDNGIGIKQDLLPEIFNFKVRDDNSPEDGHGIGLALVSQFVQRLGGSINVHSSFGEGTSFMVKIPNSKASTEKLIL